MIFKRLKKPHDLKILPLLLFQEDIYIYNIYIILVCSSNTPHFFTLYITVLLFFSSLPLNTVSNFHERKSVEGPATQSPRWIINFSNIPYRSKNSTRLIIHTRDVSKGRSKFRVKLVNTKHLWNINSQFFAAATIFLGSSVDVVKFHWTDRQFLHFRRTSF